jgi:hypothetical protein
MACCWRNREKRINHWTAILADVNAKTEIITKEIFLTADEASNLQQITEAKQFRTSHLGSSAQCQVKWNNFVYIYE